MSSHTQTQQKIDTNLLCPVTMLIDEVKHEQEVSVFMPTE